MMFMEKRFYVKPKMSVIELSNAGMLCGSLNISDKEINTEGRTSRYKGNTWNSNHWSKDESNE